jgi:hypothetical protein
VRHHTCNHISLSKYIRAKFIWRRIQSGVTKTLLGVPLGQRTPCDLTVAGLGCCLFCSFHKNPFYERTLSLLTSVTSVVTEPFLSSAIEDWEAQGSQLCAKQGCVTNSEVSSCLCLCRSFSPLKYSKLCLTTVLL